MQDGLKSYLCLGAVLIACQACDKKDEYQGPEPVETVSVSTYEFLQEQPGLFDTLISLVDRVGMGEALKSEQVTFFAPQDYSIGLALENLNYQRSRADLPAWTLDSVPGAVWDTLLHRYLVPGLFHSDSLIYADGRELVNAYGYAMNGKKVVSNASGAVEGGPVVIRYSDKNNSRFMRDWSTARTQSSDLKTTNGMLHILETGHIFGFSSFSVQANPPVQKPYHGSPLPVPGVIEAEDFDDGGQGLAYYDNDPNNNGGRYRDEMVDLENCGEGTYNVGWMGNSEWMEYSIEVAESGTYLIDTRVASPSGAGRFHYEVEGVAVTGELATPNTGGYQNWASIIGEIELEAGVHVLRFATTAAGFNVNRFTISPPPKQEPYNGTPMPVPGKIDAELYDLGGEGLGYHDNDGTNNGRQFRDDGVDITHGEEGFKVGWTSGGEWLAYTVDVAQTGDYLLETRIASPHNDKHFHVAFGETDVTGPVTIPNTNGYHLFTTLSDTVHLEAGEQVMKFHVDTDGFDLEWLKFTLIE